MQDHGPFLTPLRQADFDLAAGFEGQRLGDQCMFGQFLVDQQQGWRRLVIVELGDKGAENFRRFLGLGVGWEEGPVAIVAAATHEEDLHAGLPGDLPGRQ